MAINYPSSIDGTAQFGQPSGTSLVTSPDHAALHDNLSSFATIVENVLGASPGTNILKNFNAGDLAMRVDGGGTFKQTVQGGTINTGVFGTPSMTGGTINGQVQNNGTVANGVYGTAAYQGGTITNGVFNNGTAGTLQVNGGTMGSTVVLNPIQSSFFYQGSSTLTTATIPFLNRGIDVLSEYNGTQFVPLQSGVYQFTTQAALSGNSSDFSIEIHYNGTTVSSQRCNPNGFGIPVSWMGSVTAGGTIVAFSNGGTGAIGTFSYFWGKRVF